MKDAFETGHVIYLVMDLVKGGDLFDRIVERGRYSEAAAREVMTKLLSAVGYLHSKNIIHR
jgi:calcium/calmodulin-dependent protein kinase I